MVYNNAMFQAEYSLPNDPQELRKLCAQLQSQLADNQRLIGEQKATIAKHTQALQAKQETIAYLQEQLALLRSKRYQTQSEQLKALQGQLFDEAELEQAIREAEEALANVQQATTGKETSSSPSEKPAAPRRKPLPENLRRVDVLIDVSDEDKQSPERSFAFQRQRIQEQLIAASEEPFYREYRDLLTGTTSKRADYQQMLADAEAGRFSQTGQSTNLAKLYKNAALI